MRRPVVMGCWIGFRVWSGYLHSVIFRCLVKKRPSSFSRPNKHMLMHAVISWRLNFFFLLAFRQPQQLTDTKHSVFLSMSPTKFNCKLSFTLTSKTVSCLCSTFIDINVFLEDPVVVRSPLISLSLSVKDFASKSIKCCQRVSIFTVLKRMEKNCYL